MLSILMINNEKENYKKISPIRECTNCYKKTTGLGFCYFKKRKKQNKTKQKITDNKGGERDIYR